MDLDLVVDVDMDRDVGMDVDVGGRVDVSVGVGVGVSADPVSCWINDCIHSASSTVRTGAAGAATDTRFLYFFTDTLSAF